MSYTYDHKYGSSRTSTTNGNEIGAAKGGWDYINYRNHTDDRDRFMAWMFGKNPEMNYLINTFAWILLGLASGEIINTINYFANNN